MSFSSAQIEQLARLAHVRLKPEEIEDIGRRLDTLMSLIEPMQAIDTAGVTPMSHPLESATPLRDDVASTEDCRTAYQQIAPQTEGGLYLVPKVIE